MLTTEDYRLLNRVRFEYLLSEVSCLKNQLVHLGEDGDRLNIHCYNLPEANYLMTFIDLLTERIYLILGVHQLTIWYDDQAIYTTSLPIGIESNEIETEFEEIPNMATATMEAPTTAAKSTASNKKMATVANSTALPGQALKDVAGDVGRSVDDVKSWLNAQGMQIINFAGNEIISGEAAQATYLHFLSVIQEMMSKRGLSIASAPSAPEKLEAKPSDSNGNGNGNGATMEAKPAKTAAKAKTTARAKKTTEDGKLLRQLPRQPRQLPRKPQRSEELAKLKQKSKILEDDRNVV